MNLIYKQQILANTSCFALLHSISIVKCNSTRYIGIVDFDRFQCGFVVRMVARVVARALIINVISSVRIAFAASFSHFYRVQFFPLTLRDREL